MKLYRHKEIKTAFVVLCPERNAGLSRATVRGLWATHPGASVAAVLPNDAGEEERAGMREFCPTHVGRGTITSMINVGMDRVDAEWGVVVVQGAVARSGLVRKYSLFVDSDKDVLFPLVDRQSNFVDGSINGVMINRATWDRVGHFRNDGPLHECKATWAVNAIGVGCRFKAVLGAPIS